MNDPAQYVLGATAVATVAGAIGALITGRATARKTTSETRVIDAKLPPEVDSIVVQGAEAAVLTMQTALKSANERIKELEAAREQDARERKKDRERMAELEREVQQLRSKVGQAETSAREAREQVDELTSRMSRLMREQDNREGKRK